ncbi:DNA polymerase theta isoform X3 [Rhodnius prolixus]|uniref:DNA polymerase theta isoform X3 n=1 Tax=Rhodnius prolixus TaxID=13249 RepID=UPI003D187AA3
MDILTGSGIRVEGFMGSYNPPGGFRAVHVAICTIEKANSLVNRLLEEKNFDKIGCVVVDELHLIGDPQRGYLLELLLTKIKYICSRGAAEVQVVGMSATLPNLNDLANWLNATLYKTDFRPIPLKEFLKIGRKVLDSKELRFSHEINSTLDIKDDPGDVIYLCVDTILKGFSILVFCSTKNWCETMAQQIAVEIRRIGKSQNESALKLREQLNSEAISDILEQLKKCPVGLESSLERSISFAVGYHHAGLTMDERDIIEGAFRKNILKVIVATSTLSSGVNLPARRVIVRSPSFAGRRMDILSYKQMIGRAGRMGKDTEGESYLICTEEDRHFGEQLVKSELPAVASCLGQGNLSSSLKRALVEVIASGMVSNRSQVLEYTSCTLLAATSSQDILEKTIKSCLIYLEKNNFINSETNSDGMIASPLAVACLSSSMSPDQAIILLKELDKARQCFVLESDLHAIYQVTPFSVCDHVSIDWMKMFTIWEGLSLNLQKVGKLVGVEEGFFIKAMRSAINLNSDKYVRKLSVHKRFYTALALQELINEVPLKEVAEKFGCNKGILQTLQQSASTFSGMVTIFCRKLGWKALEVVLAELGARIQFGVQRELLALMQLDCMTGVLARSLYNAGIETLTDLAHAHIREIRIAIKAATPFVSEHSDVTEPSERKTICLPGRPGLTEVEVADLLLHEARTYLTRALGAQNVNWNDEDEESIYNQSTLSPTEWSSRRASSCMPTTDNKGHSQLIFNNHIDKNPSDTEHPKSESNLNLPKNESSIKRDNEERNNIQKDLVKEIIKVEASLNQTENIIYNVNEVLVPETQDFNISALEDSTAINSFKIADVDFVSKPKFVTNISENFSLKFSESCLVPQNIIENKSKKYSMDCTINAFENMSKRLENSSTPIGSPELKDVGVADKKCAVNCENTISSLGNNRSYDLFDSPLESNSRNIEVATNQTFLEDMDPNLGGDSLLQVSFGQEINGLSVVQNRGTKRKIASPLRDNIHSRKKSCFAAENKLKNLGNQRKKTSNSSVSDFFDSFEMNTQVEEVISKKPEEVCPLVQPTSSEIVISKEKEKPKNTVMESFLIDAFDDTFDAPIQEETIKVLLKDFRVHEQPSVSKDEVMNISDLRSEDLFSKDISVNKVEKNKGNCKIWRTPTKKINKTTFSPAKIFSPSKSAVKSPHSKSKLKDKSPSKYPSIGISIIKQSKSPQRMQGNTNICVEQNQGGHYLGNDNKITAVGNAITINQELDINKESSNLESFNNGSVKACSETSLIKEFLSSMLNRKEAAFSLQFEDVAEEQAQIIGAKLLAKDITRKSYKFQYKSKALTAMAITWGQKSYLFELISPDCGCFNTIKSLMEMKQIKLWGYETKVQLKLLSKCCNVMVGCELFDVSVARWLLVPDEKIYSLRELANKYNVTSNIQDSQLSQETMMIWQLHNVLLNKLKHYNLLQVFREVEMPAQFILMNMEISGIKFNRKEVQELWSKVEITMKILENKAFQIANKKFNLASRNDLKKIKELLKIKTDVEINHPLTVIVRNWRKLSSLKSRTLSQLLMTKMTDDRLFAECCTRTQTGRVNIYDPSLQNVPRDFSVDDVLFSVRSTFTPAEGNVLLSADFCQLELRILAHYSGDSLLTEMIKSDLDVFISIASGWFNVHHSQVNQEMRHQTKQICYGILYGMGDHALGEVLGVSTAEAAELAAKFRLRYPGVGRFIEQTVEECRKVGYVNTLTGRYRRLPHINSSKTAERLQAERQAVNSQIQGSAADIAKKAMVNIEKRLTQVFPNRTNVLQKGGEAAHLVLQLHDELLYEVAENNVHMMSRIVKEEMENTFHLNVPLTVVVKIGKSWGQLKRTEIS